MLAIKISDPEIESRVSWYAKKQNISSDDVVREAMRLFLDRLNKTESHLTFSKKDPMKHLVKNDFQDDEEDLSEARPYSHVEDSASYVHDMRRKKLS